MTLLAGSALILLAVVLRPWPEIQARAAMIGVGLFTIVVAWLRPLGFWEAGSIVLLREMIGDQATRWIYIVIGLMFVGVGLLIP